MQFSTLFLSAIAAATAVVGQNLTGLPACAVPCFEDNLAYTTCAATDTYCLCTDTNFYSLVQVCVLTDCSSDADIATTLSWATATCAAVGVTLSKKRSILGRAH